MDEKKKNWLTNSGLVVSVFVMILGATPIPIPNGSILKWVWLIVAFAVPSIAVIGGIILTRPRPDPKLADEGAEFILYARKSDTYFIWTIGCGLVVLSLAVLTLLSIRFDAVQKMGMGTFAMCVAVSIFPPLFGGLATFSIFEDSKKTAERIKANASTRFCHECGYTLEGLKKSENCPECGKKVPS